MSTQTPFVDYYETLVQEDLDVGIGVATKRNPGGGTLAGTQVGIHSFATGQAAVTASWTPGVVPTGGQVTTTVSVPGANLGDFAASSFSLSLQGLVLSSYVSAANTVTVVLANLTGAGVTIGLGTLRVLVLPSR